MNGGITVLARHLSHSQLGKLVFLSDIDVFDDYSRGSNELPL